MSQHTSSGTPGKSGFSNPAAARSRGFRFAALAAVVLVPLAFAGLFVSALPDADEALDTIPAAIVNDDTLVTQTAADGTETPVFAGRQLVTELTGDDATGFDWQITNEKDAEAALKAGTVYAILTVPSDFSKSILSAQGDNPVKADISIRVDDSHSYVTSLVAQTVGATMASTFGNEITKQYITGLNSGLSELGTSLGDASDGATKISDGTSDLGDGLGQLADGIDSAADGAHEYSDGIDQYTGGVDGISDGLGALATGTKDLPQLATGIKEYTRGVDTISDGLKQVKKNTKKLPELSEGIARYTGGVSQLSAGIAQATADLKANPNDPVALGTLSEYSKQLETAAAGGAALSEGAAGLPDLTTGIAGLSDGLDQASDGSSALRKGANGIKKVSGGIAELADGADQLSAGSSQLRSGARGLADGLDDIGTGAEKSADGADQLASGGKELADGLAKGADLVPESDSDQAKATANVASDPVTFTLKTDNAVKDIGQIVATILVPLGLWLGALAVFLVLAPATRRSLASTAGNRRLVFATLSRAGIVTGAQALLLVGLLHLGLHVEWSLLPATLLFSLLTAFAFTAFHYLLTTAFGRVGLVISLFLLAIQVTSTGGLYPVELLATPFQVLSPFLPLTYGVSGMQAILSGSSVSSAVLAAVVLLAVGVLSVLISLLAIRRTRRASALGLVPATA